MSGGQVRIVIIGAGIAGLSAAQRLHREGFRDVTILEGCSRTGGRIFTTNFGTYNKTAGLVELGANWIHGTGEDNSVYCLANHNSLLEPYVLLDRMEGFCYTEDGRRIPKNLTDRAWEIFQQAGDDMDRYYVSSTEESITCLDYFNKCLRSALLKFPKSERGDVWAVFRCMLNYSAFHVGDELSRASLKYSGTFVDIPGGNVKLPGGFSGVVDTILKDIPAQWIRLDHKVEKIRWQSDQGSKINVMCSNKFKEKTFIADHVILTSSLGYLKKHHEVLFSPKLPKYKVNSIVKMGFGKVNKMFLHFKNPFWSKGIGSVKFAWSENTFEYDPVTWYKAIFAFDEVLNNDTVLVGWIYGRAAEYMETLSDDEVKQTCAWLLRKFLKRPSIPTPDSVIRSSWCSNEYSQGSYSYVTVGATDRDLRNLSQPLYHGGKPVVLFSGEATHPKYYSTTHGARSSGQREAERLCNYYSTQSKL